MKVSLSNLVYICTNIYVTKLVIAMISVALVIMFKNILTFVISELLRRSKT